MVQTTIKSQTMGVNEFLDIDNPKKPQKTLIIHGYSDCSESFIGIKQFLNNNNIPAEAIYYADYESREDNITFNDVVDGLNDEMIRLELITANGQKNYDLNIIVHSTGGLVIRNWIMRFYKDRIADCPVKRLVMLAPANFGSPLAVRGKSFLGKLFKGRWKVGDFLEVGRQILDGLELASPYQWALAHRDLFNEKPFYSADGIQVTILVGANDYTGARGWVNKPGTDGTVVISGTSLNSIKLNLSFSRPSKGTVQNIPFKWNTTTSVNEIAFGVLPGMDHGSIVEMAGQKGNNASNFLLRAINNKSKEDFIKLREDLSIVTENTYTQDPDKKLFQQFILHTVDNNGISIHDYHVEFFIFKASRTNDHTVAHSDNDEELIGDELTFSSKVHQVMTKEFATNTGDPSFRRFLVDINEVSDIIEEAKTVMKDDVLLSMKVYVPEVDSEIGYENKEIEKIVLYNTKKTDNQSPSFLFPNTTTLIEISVDRINKYVTIGLDPKKH